MPSAIERLEAAQREALAIRPKVGGFPVLAAVLHRAGVRRNEWTLPAAQCVYRTDLGSVVQLGTPVGGGTQVVPSFDRDAVIQAIRTNQAGESTFPEFLESAFLAGVIRYDVDFDARTVTYYGLDDDRYVESYPDVPIDQIRVRFRFWELRPCRCGKTRNSLRFDQSFGSRSTQQCLLTHGFPKI